MAPFGIRQCNGVMLGRTVYARCVRLASSPYVTVTLSLNCVRSWVPHPGGRMIRGESGCIVSGVGGQCPWDGRVC